jgi:hypothetical protein
MKKKLSLYLELCKKGIQVVCESDKQIFFVKEDIIWKLSKQIYLCML